MVVRAKVGFRCNQMELDRLNHTYSIYSMKVSILSPISAAILQKRKVILYQKGRNIHLLFLVIN